MIPYSEQKNQYVNMRLYKETFAEHNFLWTQWKKLKHFERLKTKAETMNEDPNAPEIKHEDSSDVEVEVD